MRIILYHTGKCSHGHDTLDFSKKLFSSLSARELAVFPAKPPSRHILNCHLSMILGHNKKGNLLLNFQQEPGDYLLIINDPDLQHPVALEWTDSGDIMNNAELFNDYLTRRGIPELPTELTANNVVAKKLADSGDKPFCILRVNGTDVDSVVGVVELYREYLA